MLWQNDLLLDGFAAGKKITEIPVYFQIPAGAQPTGTGVSWQLNVHAKTQDGQYHAAFQIPVSSGPASREMLDLPDETAPFRSLPEPRDGPRDRHIVFGPLPGGGCRVKLLPRRNLVLGIAGICFGLLFMGVAALVEHFFMKDPHAPIWFPICFGLMGLTSFLVGVRLLLLKTTIIAEGGTLGVERSIWIGRRRWEIPAESVADVTTELQGQSFNRMFYSINMRRVNGSTVKICGTIYDRKEAEWLAAEIKNTLGIAAPPKGATIPHDS